MRAIRKGLLLVILAVCAMTGGHRALHAETMRSAIFAGGCFWCMEPPFERLDGVQAVISGFAGGVMPNPTYKQVSEGGTGYLESVLVVYDADKVTYKTLLDIYWHNIDPFNGEGQFCDYGDQYKSVIFVDNPADKDEAETSRRAVVKHFGQGVVTEVRELEGTKFYPAEDHHQDYYLKHPWRYKFYRGNCKRDERLHQLWGDSAGGYSYGTSKAVK